MIHPFPLRVFLRFLMKPPTYMNWLPLGSCSWIVVPVGARIAKTELVVKDGNERIVVSVMYSRSLCEGCEHTCAMHPRQLRGGVQVRFTEVAEGAEGRQYFEGYYDAD